MPIIFAAALVGVLINVEAGKIPQYTSLEHDPDMRSPIVYQEKPNGEVLLKDAQGKNVWLMAPAKTRVRSFEQIFAVERLSYLTQHWDAKLFQDATKTAEFSQRQAFRLPDRKLPKPTATQPYTRARDVEVIERKTIEGVVWMKVKLVEQTACTAAGGKATYTKHPVTGQEVEGWVPLKNDAGELNFWFYPRGC